jgi:hypothetical protein
MTKSRLAFRLSLASVAAMMVSLTTTQSALAQNAQNAIDRNGNATTSPPEGRSILESG